LVSFRILLIPRKRYTAVTRRRSDRHQQPGLRSAWLL